MPIGPTRAPPVGKEKPMGKEKLKRSSHLDVDAPGEPKDARASEGGSESTHARDKSRARPGEHRSGGGEGSGACTALRLPAQP